MNRKYKHTINWTDRKTAKPIESREEAIAIGEAMAKKASKKLKLDFNLPEKPQPDQSSRLLAEKWSDPKLHKYMSKMSCGYKHYDMNIIEMLEAQRDLTASIKDAEISQQYIKGVEDGARFSAKASDARMGALIDEAKQYLIDHLLLPVAGQGVSYYKYHANLFEKALKANPTSEVEG